MSEELLFLMKEEMKIKLTVSVVSGENPNPSINKTDINVKSRHVNGCSVLGSWQAEKNYI